MPGYKIHVLIGLVVTSLLLGVNFLLMRGATDPTTWPIQLAWYDYLVVYALTIIYCQLPDIDTEISVISKYFKSVALAFIIAAFLLSWNEIGIAIALFLLLLEWSTHRGILHTIQAGILFAFPLLYFSWIYFAAAFIAHSTHLIADGEFTFSPRRKR